MTGENMADADLRASLDRLETRALFVGIAGLAGCVAAWAIWPADFFPAYLVGFLYWLGIALGSASFVMLNHLASGSWGLVIRRPLESGATIIWPLAVLFLPIAFGASSLYPWAHAGSAAGEHAVEPHPYLTLPFFWTRAAIYFGIWGTIAFVINALSNRQDRTQSDWPTRWLQALSGPGMVLLFLGGSFSAIDWMMALDPKWTSTIYGIMIIVGDGLATLAVMDIAAALLSRSKPVSDVAISSRLNDLGNLTLAFVMLWAYSSFCQFLIIWSGNLSEEIPWYIRRTRGGWGWFAVALIAFQFFSPFFMLLMRSNKQRPRWLMRIAGWLLFMHWINLVWLVIPASNDVASPSINWLRIGLSAVAMVGIGGISVAFLVDRLKRRPLVPLNDPQLNQWLSHGEG
jgi:hypothetical protein